MKKSLLFIFAILFTASMFGQECSDLFISEYVEGSGNNKALEIYNPTNEPIDLANYKLVRYSNGGTVPYAVGLAGMIQSKTTYVVVLDKRDPNGIGFEQPVDSALQIKADTFLCPVYEVNRMMYFNGNDAVTLEKIDGTIVDIFGRVGPPMTKEDNGWGNLNDTTITYNSGGVPTEYTIHDYIVGPLFWLSWTKDNTLIRKANVSQGVKANPDPYFIVDVQWDSLPKNTFDSLGFHNCDCTTFGINENNAALNIHVYPNPVMNGEFSVEAQEAIESVEIYDITGRLVEVKEMAGRLENIKLKTNNNLSGLYLVKIQLTSGKVGTKKLLFK